MYDDDDDTELIEFCDHHFVAAYTEHAGNNVSSVTMTVCLAKF